MPWSPILKGLWGGGADQALNLNFRHSLIIHCLCGPRQASRFSESRVLDLEWRLKIHISLKLQITQVENGGLLYCTPKQSLAFS